MISDMTCSQVATLVGYVAVDRDAGVPLEVRMADTLKALMGQQITNPGEVLHAVSWTYATKGTPVELSRQVATTCTIPGIRSLRKVVV